MSNFTPESTTMDQSSLMDPLDIMEITDLVTNRIIAIFKDYEDTIREYNTMAQSIKQLKGLRDSYTEKHREEVPTAEELLKIENELDTIKQSKISEKDELNKNLQSLMEKYSLNEAKLAKLKEKRKKTIKRSQSLEILRAEVEISKRATNTSFQYTEPTVTGYISGDITTKCFSYCPEKLSKEEISHRLIKDMISVFQK